MNSDAERLSERLAALAQEAGSVSGLARICGIPQRTMAGYVAGEREPRASDAVTIAGRMGVSLDWLLTGRGSMRPSPAGTGMAENGGTAWGAPPPSASLTVPPGHGLMGAGLPGQSDMVLIPDLMAAAIRVMTAATKGRELAPERLERLVMTIYRIGLRRRLRMAEGEKVPDLDQMRDDPDFQDLINAFD